MAIMYSIGLYWLLLIGGVLSFHYRGWPPRKVSIGFCAVFALAVAFVCWQLGIERLVRSNILFIYFGIGFGVAMAGYGVYRAFKWRPPLWAGLVYGALAIAFMAGVTQFFTTIGIFSVRLDAGMFTVIFPSAPAIWVAGRMVAASIGEKVADQVYMARYNFPREYGKAQTRLEAGDIEGAIAAYRLYFDEEPHDVEPLFLAAALAEEDDRVEEAESIYRQILRDFSGDDDVCGEAREKLDRLAAVGTGA